MSVVIASEEIGPCRKKLTIEVPAEAVKAEMGRVVGDYRRDIKLPGFRRGKVPASLVLKRFRDEVEQEVMERLVPRYWSQAEAEQNLDLLLPPRFEEPSLEEGEPLTLIASVEVRPEIEIEILDDFELPEEETAPSEADIEVALTDLRRNFADWIPVERFAARGDLVVGRIREIDAEDSEDAEERPLQLELGAEGVDEELNLALSGLTAGQGADYRRQEGEGDERIERQFRIEVDAVKERELPELDDALADRVGDFDTVDDLRQALVSDLERRKTSDLRQRRREALLEQLRTRYPLALPEGVVDRERETMLQRYGEQLVSQGVDLENAPIDWEALMGQVKPAAEREVHNRLLLDAIAKSEEIRLDERQFEAFLTNMAAHQKTTALALRRQLNDNGRLEPLRGQLLREQVLRQLLGEDSQDPDAAGVDAGSGPAPEDAED